MEKNLKRLVSQRNVLLIFASIFSLAIVSLSLLLFSKKERVVIVPTSGCPYWIEEGNVSSGYIEKMGLFLSDLLLNRSPSDIDKKNQIILGYVHPASYHQMKKSLLQERESIVKNNQSYFFQPNRTYIDQGNTFVIEGEFLVFVGKNGEMPFCAQKERKKYRLGFCCQNGKVLLTSLRKEDLE